MDPGKPTSGYYLEAILLGGVSLFENPGGSRGL